MMMNSEFVRLQIYLRSCTRLYNAACAVCLFDVSLSVFIHSLCVWQYLSLLRTVSNQLELDLSSNLLQQLNEAPVGATRDALVQQRRKTVELVKESLSNVKDEMRRKSEIAERSQNNLHELRFATVAFCQSS